MINFPRVKQSYYNIVLITLLLSLPIIITCNNCHNPNEPASTQKLAIIREEAGPGKNKGIGNIGNSCYMNAVIQILASFYQGAFSKTSSSVAKAGNDIIKSITGQEQATPATITAKARKFFEALEKTPAEGGIGWIGKSSSQEDANELLQGIFDKLQFPTAQDLSTLTNPTTSVQRPGKPIIFNIWQIALEDNSQTMQDLFNKSLTSTVEVKWQDNDLVNTSVQEAHELQGLNTLCERMLVISLNRFVYDQTMNASMKITSPVSNSFTLTVKKEQTVEKKQDLPYQLAGFIHHLGATSNRGHYVAYIKENEKWILYDDSRVSEVSAAAAETAASQAYVFFYEPQKP